MKLAILGATGYIGRALMHELMTAHPQAAVTPFVRDRDAAEKLWGGYGVPRPTNASVYDDLLAQEFDIIINATGIGSPKKLAEDPIQIFAVTEAMDALLVSYLGKHPKARVFNLSSGAVYGKAVGDFVGDDTMAGFLPNDLKSSDYYALVKLHSEAKHRSRPEYHIVDLRVFAFISRFLDTNDAFFLSDVARCLKSGETLVTNPNDMVRDFIAADDILSVIDFLAGQPPQNGVFDLRSRAPVAKFELLEHLKDALGLSYQVSEMNDNNPTGVKHIYASTSVALAGLGCQPSHTALENVERELTAFLNR